MAIEFRCGCGRALTAPESAAGRRGRCPGCGAIFAVPAAALPVPVLELDGGYALAEEASPSPPVRRSRSIYAPPPSPGRVAAVPVVPIPAGPPLPASRPYHYLVLLLALLPLAWATVHPADHHTTVDRIRDTLAAHPEARSRYDDLPESADERAVMAVLPADRCDGALLPYDTWDHWAMAAATAAGYFGLILLLFPPGHSKLWHLVAVGTFTGTAGIVLLLAFQWLAFHMPLFRGSGVITLVLDGIWLIGQSYRMALGDHGVVLSALGFTAGVGFCEETCKALPLLFKTRTSGFVSWRSALLWGLVSGVGFGVSEGITYSSDYYNGVLGGQIYVVRFVSCVALHGIWAAATGIAIYRHRASFAGRLSGADWLGQVLRVIVVPMCLHGLYDTLLKQQYDGAALGVALASFGWLAVQIELAKRRLDGATPAAAFA